MLTAMIANLAMATFMVGVTVAIHFFGLLLLLRALRWRGGRFLARRSVVGQGALVLFVVFGVFSIHTVEF